MRLYTAVERMHGSPEARAFIAKRYDEQGNIRPEFKKQEKAATPIDPDAGKKYGEAVQDLVRFAQDTHVACMKWGKFESGSIEETNLVSEILTAAHTASLAANRVKRLDAAQGGVR